MNTWQTTDTITHHKNHFYKYYHVPVTLLRMLLQPFKRVIDKTFHYFEKKTCFIYYNSNLWEKCLNPLSTPHKPLQKQLNQLKDTVEAFIKYSSSHYQVQTNLLSRSTQAFIKYNASLYLHQQNLFQEIKPVDTTVKHQTHSPRYFY